MTELEEYYNKFNEEKRLNSRHGRVEFITSMKYIHDCLGSLMNEKQLDLRSQIKILDVGAGTADIQCLLPRKAMMRQHSS